MYYIDAFSILHYIFFLKKVWAQYKCQYWRRFFIYHYLNQKENSWFTIIKYASLQVWKHGKENIIQMWKFAHSPFLVLEGYRKRSKKSLRNAVRRHSFKYFQFLRKQPTNREKSVWYFRLFSYFSLHICILNDFKPC